MDLAVKHLHLLLAALDHLLLVHATQHLLVVLLDKHEAFRARRLLLLRLLGRKLLDGGIEGADLSGFVPSIALLLLRGLGWGDVIVVGRAAQFDRA